MNIRRMEEKDRNGVMTLAKDFFGVASRGTSYSWSKDGFHRMFDISVNDSGSFVGIVAEDEEEIKGVLIFAVLPSMAYEQVVAQELIWYVSPDARGSVGIRMFKMAEELARIMGANAMVFVANKASGFDKVCEFYRRQGYKEIEHLYQKDL